ncbi:MAG: hypothetical protein KKA32_10800 [Actinobacteria bacterium]|nr:hypothetical protein [Actinomycetota bacterium]
MKKAIVIGLALIFVLSMTVVAFAVPGIPSAGTGYQTGYLTPAAGVNPHSLYSNTSNKCKTCHAVHAAGVGGQALLRSSKADACVFCHVSATYTIKKPYGPDPAFYTTEYENNHASTHQGSGYNGCVSCHSVHGANTFVAAGDGITAGKILKNNPGGAPVGVTTGALAAPAATLDEFCRDCHDNLQVTGGGVCANCHVDVMLVSSYQTRDQRSHIQTTTLTNAVGAVVATAASTKCRSCHKGAAVYADANSFPHLTSGAQFLTDTHTATSPLDRVCLQCHPDVGSTF